MSLSTNFQFFRHSSLTTCTRGEPSQTLHPQIVCSTSLIVWGKKRRMKRLAWHHQKATPCVPGFDHCSYDYQATTNPSWSSSNNTYRLEHSVPPVQYIQEIFEGSSDQNIGSLSQGPGPGIDSLWPFPLLLTSIYTWGKKHLAHCKTSMTKSWLKSTEKLETPKERTIHGIKVLVKPCYHGYMCNNHSAQRIQVGPMIYNTDLESINQA